ncbi:MAG: ribonuclease E/G [Nocardioidaceae bacterium]
MTVVDVNTGKFTGSGGNLEETVTKNNLEAAEEIVRQLRLRDIGGIIVIDFIDMVLENNRDLVLRRLVECLGRDRTRHQVAEVTSLGLVQMTRKRIGTGLLEAFSEPCEHCHGRGLTVHDQPVEPHSHDDSAGRGTRRRGGRGGDNLAAAAATAEAAASALPNRLPNRRPSQCPKPRLPRQSRRLPRPAGADNAATTGDAARYHADRDDPTGDQPQPPRRRSARRPAGAATVADAPQAPDSVLTSEGQAP